MSTLKLALLLGVILAVVGADMPSSPICRAPFVWNGKKCVCPTGMVNCNGKCICDYGYWPVGAGCSRCDSQNNYNGKSCAGSPNNIPDGYTWNGKFIIQNWAVNNCDALQFWNGVGCSPLNYPVSCKPGYTWNGKTCVRTDLDGCPTGAYWNGKSFVPFVNPPICEKYYVWNSPTQGCLYILTKMTCPSNRYFNGSSCTEAANPIKCCFGYYYNGDACVSYGPEGMPVCVGGTSWDGRSCTKAVKSCSDRWYLDPTTNSCIEKACKNGQRIDILTQTCPLSLASAIVNGQTGTITASPLPLNINVSTSSITLPIGTNSLPVPNTTLLVPPSFASLTQSSVIPGLSAVVPPSALLPTTIGSLDSTISAGAPTGPSAILFPTNVTPTDDSSSEPASALVSTGGVAALTGDGLVVAPGSNAYGSVPPTLPIDLNDNTQQAQGDATASINNNDSTSIAALLPNKNAAINSIAGSGRFPNIDRGKLVLPNAFGSTIIQHPSIGAAGSKLPPISDMKNYSANYSSKPNRTTSDSTSQSDSSSTVDSFSPKTKVYQGPGGGQGGGRGKN